MIVGAAGPYAASPIYFKAGASQTIVDRLAGIALYTQKRFCDSAVAMSPFD